MHYAGSREPSPDVGDLPPETASAHSLALNDTGVKKNRIWKIQRHEYAASRELLLATLELKNSMMKGTFRLPPFSVSTLVMTWEKSTRTAL